MDLKIAKKLVEALIFSSKEPLSEKNLELMMTKHGNFNFKKIISELKDEYKNNGINLVCVDKKWFFSTSKELSSYLRIETDKKRKLSLTM